MSQTQHKRRSLLEQELDTLRAITEGTRRLTPLIQKVGIMWSKMHVILRRLETCSLVSPEYQGARVVYEATPLGFEFVRTFDELLDMVGLNDA